MGHITKAQRDDLVASLGFGPADCIFCIVIGISTVQVHRHSVDEEGRKIVTFSGEVASDVLTFPIVDAD